MCDYRAFNHKDIKFFSFVFLCGKIKIERKDMLTATCGAVTVYVIEKFSIENRCYRQLFCRELLL